MNQIHLWTAHVRETGLAGTLRDNGRLDPAEKHILGIVPDTLVVIDLEGNVLFANDRVKRAFGLKPTEVIGQEMTDLIAERFRGSYSRLVHQFVDARPPISHCFESRGLRANGVDFPIRVRLGHLKKGGETFILTLIQDLTEIETLRAQLWRSQELEPIALLASSVAHDLNNALTATNGYLEILLRSSHLDDSTRSMLQETALATKHATSLATQMIAFKEDSQEAVRELNLNEIVSATKRIFGGLLGKNVNVVTRLDPELGYVRTDTCQMERVIINLVVNARDAIDGNGQIIIETANIHQDRTESGIPSGNYVMLAVSDDGCGMEEKTIVRIFEPLFTTKPPGKGTGLGLSSVAEIVKNHGGFIRVKSEPGQGATFQLFFPRITETETAACGMEQQPTA